MLNEWVTRLGDAWVKKDVDAALALVSKEKIEWQESPLEKPLTNWTDIYKVWESDLAKQKDIIFSHEVLACNDHQGIVRWKATLTNTKTSDTTDMDGMFLISLDDKNLCTKFTMWTESKVRI